MEGIDRLAEYKEGYGKVRCGGLNHALRPIHLMSCKIINSPIKKTLSLTNKVVLEIEL